MNGNPFQLIQQFQRMKDPKGAFMQMMQNNPQYQQMFNQLQNSANGASAEQMARQIAKQRGISEEQLMQMYNSLARR
jgi:formate dehydrogenase maturation protein FdhE